MEQTHIDATEMMAKARLGRGEHEDDIEAHLITYLRARGYDKREAARQAQNAVQKAQADRDGVAGAGAMYL